MSPWMTWSSSRSASPSSRPPRAPLTLHSPSLSENPTMPAPVVVMETSLGTIKIELNEEKAPISTKNFLSYVDDKFYDNTTFHRVIPGFVIQGGGFEPGMKQKKTKDPIRNESGNGLPNARGTLS